MDEGLIELLRQSQTLLDHGDTEQLMNSSIWNAALCAITRLIVELRGNNLADLALQLQSDLDRLESGVEDGVVGEPEFRRSAKYRRWSAIRRLVSDVEWIARLAERSPAFLNDRSPSLSRLVGSIEPGNDCMGFTPTPAMANILQAIWKSKTTLIQVDIEQVSGEPIKTIKSLLPELEDRGYVHRPHGERKGYAITDKGLQLLARAGRSIG